MAKKTESSKRAPQVLGVLKRVAKVLKTYSVPNEKAVEVLLAIMSVSSFN